MGESPALWVRLWPRPVAARIHAFGIWDPGYRYGPLFPLPGRPIWPELTAGSQPVQLEISTRHGHLSEATQAKLRAKAEKLARFFDRLTSIEVVVDLEHPQQTGVEVLVSAEHRHDFVAQETAESLAPAMDAAVQKIEEQLRRYKERVQDRHRDHDNRRREAPEI